jgi:hypothetical protein
VCDGECTHESEIGLTAKRERDQTDLCAKKADQSKNERMHAGSSEGKADHSIDGTILWRAMPRSMVMWRGCSVAVEGVVKACQAERKQGEEQRTKEERRKNGWRK